VAFAAALALAAPVAGQVTSSVRETIDEGGDLQRSQSVTYRAATGQRNVVRVQATASEVLISDQGAELTAGHGCVAVTAHDVSCAIAVSLTDSENTLSAAAFGGDGDDELTAVAPAAPYAVVSVLGGAGDDT
jgi:hypothetical protein